MFPLVKLAQTKDRRSSTLIMALSKILKDRKVVPQPAVSLGDVKRRLVEWNPCLGTNEGLS
jgi:hypothetical protein